MKMTLNEALVLNDIVKALIDNKDMKISAIFKFKLLGIAKELENPVANFYAVRESKIAEYGTEAEDENGNKLGHFEIKMDNTEAMGKFKNDLDELVQKEIEVNIQKLKVQEVFDAGVPSDYLVKLFNIIEE
jgi:hypothetical protein